MVPGASQDHRAQRRPDAETSGQQGPLPTQRHCASARDRILGDSIIAFTGLAGAGAGGLIVRNKANFDGGEMSAKYRSKKELGGNRRDCPAGKTKPIPRAGIIRPAREQGEIHAYARVSMAPGDRRMGVPCTPCTTPGSTISAADSPKSGKVRIASRAEQSQFPGAGIASSAPGLLARTDPAGRQPVWSPPGPRRGTNCAKQSQFRWRPAREPVVVVPLAR
jgi:hypothetical protein